MMDIPSVDDTPVEMPGTTSIGSNSTNSVQSSSQSNFTVRFGTPNEDQHVDEIRLSVETAEGDNVYPRQQVDVTFYIVHIILVIELYLNPFDMIKST